VPHAFPLTWTGCPATTVATLANTVGPLISFAQPVHRYVSVTGNA
jgi:hypothetical protein